MRGRALAACAVAGLAFGLAGTAPAAEVIVGSGASVDLGSGSLHLGCADLVVGGALAGGTGTMDQARDVTIQGGGTLNGQSATLSVTGDWSNSGSFNRGTSMVRFVDGCGRSSAAISGDSSFFGLDLTTSSGKLYAFAQGSTQTVTDSLTLAGAEGNRLRIRSSVDGSEAYLDLQGGQSVSFVEVKDNHAIGNHIEYGPESSSLGNTLGWVLVGVPVPSISAPGLLLLALGMAWMARKALGGRRARRGLSASSGGG